MTSSSLFPMTVDATTLSAKTVHVFPSPSCAMGQPNAATDRTKILCFAKVISLSLFVHFAKLVLMLIINLDLSSTLEIVPSRVTALPWRPFKFTCVSSTAERPSVILLRDRKPIELDPRFSVKRYRDNSIEVSAPHGLASLGPDETLVYVSTRFGFYFPTLFL